MKYLLISLGIAIIACNNNSQKNAPNTRTTEEYIPNKPSVLHFRGALRGGMKGDSIFFDVRGNRLEDLTFKGYWRCDGKLEMQNPAGPSGYFTIVDNKVNDHISEPPDGGATAWRFDLKADIDGNKASGTFRMNINALGCNTGTLSWDAIAD